MTAREIAKLARHIIETYPITTNITASANSLEQDRHQPAIPCWRMNIAADGLKTGFIKEAGYGLARPRRCRTDCA